MQEQSGCCTHPSPGRVPTCLPAGHGLWLSAPLWPPRSTRRTAYLVPYLGFMNSSSPQPLIWQCWASWCSVPWHTCLKSNGDRNQMQEDLPSAYKLYQDLCWLHWSPIPRESLSAGYRDVQRSSSHPAEGFHVSASVLSPAQRKALNSTAAQLPGCAQCLRLSRLPSSLMGKDAPFCRGICFTWHWDGSGLSCCQGSQSPSFPQPLLPTAGRGWGAGTPGHRVIGLCWESWKQSRHFVLEIFLLPIHLPAKSGHPCGKFWLWQSTKKYAIE